MFLHILRQHANWTAFAVAAALALMIVFSLRFHAKREGKKLSDIPWWIGAIAAIAAYSMPTTLVTKATGLDGLLNVVLVNPMVRVSFVISLIVAFVLTIRQYVLAVLAGKMLIFNNPYVSIEQQTQEAKQKAERIDVINKIFRVIVKFD